MTEESSPSVEIVNTEQDSLVAKTEGPELSSKLAEELDALIISYLDLFDKYQLLQEDIASSFSNGFMSIAQANYASSNRRYGQDYYDQRMRALKVLDIDLESEEYPLFSVVDVMKLEVKTQIIAEKTDTSGLRQRKAVFSGIQDSTSDDTKEQSTTQEVDVKTDPPTENVKELPKLNLKDPLRWFGILRPPALAKAQASFSAALPKLVEVVNVVQQIELYEQRIKEMEKKVAAKK